MDGTRRDVATLGPSWNKTLLNYALAMRALDALPIGDRNSWRFLGAIHGFDHPGWVRAGVLKQSDQIPSELTDGTFGDQCQHGSWYFLPWHRGYLAAFEAIVAAKVKELTGDDWALPYWNYLDHSSARASEIPHAFVADTLPDGSANPLVRYPRLEGITALPEVAADEFNLQCMEEGDFIVGKDGSIGFGGGVTGDFVQFAGMTGDLEANPHNSVHGMIGGFMGHALYAGLDPLFWLHHCNIDRLWEAWMRAPGKTMVRDPRWLGGPADRTFVMPAVGGRNPGITFTAQDTLRGGRLHPNYDDLAKGTGVTPGGPAMAKVGMGPASDQRVEVVGASTADVVVGGASSRTHVDLEPTAVRSGVATMGATATGAAVTRFYLALEGVRGAAPSPLLRVYLNLPEGADPGAHSDLRAGSIRLFGLNVASASDGRHGGNGLGYKLDITDIAARLQAAGNFDPDRLAVTLVPADGISDAEPVTVSRIAVIKRSGVVS